MMDEYEIKFVHTARWICDSANSEADAKQQALCHLALNGWAFVDDEKLVTEVERVYATRIDCMALPEGVRQAA